MAVQATAAPPGRPTRERTEQYKAETEAAAYDERELYKLYLRFRNCDNRLEILSGLMGLPESSGNNDPQAKALLEKFDSMATASSQPPSIVTEPKHSPKRTRSRQKKVEAVTDDIEPPDEFQTDALFAAIVNMRSGFSEIIAEGRTEDKAIIVERFRDGIIRTKFVTYTYFSSAEGAIAAAKSHGIKIKVSGSR